MDTNTPESERQRLREAIGCYPFDDENERTGSARMLGLVIIAVACGVVAAAAVVGAVLIFGGRHA